MESATTELRVAVERPRTWARRLTITVPADRVARARADVVRRLAQRVRVPGFRKGRVPPGVLERQYGPAIDQEAVERVVGEAYREAIRREGLEPVSQVAVEEIDYRPGSDLTFRVAFEVWPEVVLNRLGGFRIRVERPEVEEADVDRVLERLRREHAAWRAVEGEPPVAGDVAVIELVRPGPDGAPGEPRRYRLALGEGRAAPELEQAVYALRPGEEAEVEVPVAGGEGSRERVRVRLLEAQRPELPALDDAFAARVGPFADLAALRAAVREDLERAADAEAEEEVRRQLVDHILEANPFEVPEAVVNRSLERLVPGERGADAERIAELRRLARPAVERSVKRALVLQRVAELEGLQPTEAEVEARIEELARRAGRPVAEVRARLERTGQRRALEEQILENKVFAFLASLSEVERGNPRRARGLEA